MTDAAGEQRVEEIIRADLVRCDGESGRCRADMEMNIGGDWVLYADHKTRADALAARLRAVEDERDKACENLAGALDLQEYTKEQLAAAQAEARRLQKELEELKRAR